MNNLCEQTIKEIIEVLHFYADRNNYFQSDIEDDGGLKARILLESIRQRGAE